MYIPNALLALLLSTTAGIVFAANDCNGLAKNGFERVYCEVKARGEGAGLPTLDDFRRNNTQVQALLLKRPAQRLGLTLPPINQPLTTRKHSIDRTLNSKEKSKTLAAGVTSKTKVDPLARLKKQSSIQKPVIQKSVITKQPTQKTRLAAADLSHCQLLGESISCAQAHYQLQDNLNNRHLSPTALSAANQLGLESYRGGRNDAPAIHRYLGTSYRRYIEKMLEIGLGSATMSYTKFYYTFTDLAQKGEEFSTRFETMFGYLKKDKASMGIKARYTNELPGNLSQCADLSDRLIVCDNGNTNWVYASSI